MTDLRLVLTVGKDAISNSNQTNTTTTTTKFVSHRLLPKFSVPWLLLQAHFPLKSTFFQCKEASLQSGG